MQGREQWRHAVAPAVEDRLAVSGHRAGQFDEALGFDQGLDDAPGDAGATRVARRGDDVESLQQRGAADGEQPGVAGPEPDAVQRTRLRMVAEDARGELVE